LAGLLALTFLRSLLALLRLAFCLSFAGLLGSTLLDGLALLLGLGLFGGLGFAGLLGLLCLSGSRRPLTQAAAFVGNGPRRVVLGPRLLIPGKLALTGLTCGTPTPTGPGLFPKKKPRKWLEPGL